MKYYKRFDYNTYVINEDAINRITAKHIFSSEKINKLIQHYCMETLNISATRKDGLQNEEVGILFHLDGIAHEKFYGEYKRTSRNGVVILDIAFDPRYTNMLQEYPSDPLAFVHNHPNLSIISGNDFIEFLSTDNIKLLLVVGNDGLVSFALKTFKKSYYKLGRIIADRMDNEPWSNIYANIINNSTKLGLMISDRDIVKYQGGI